MKELIVVLVVLLFLALSFMSFICVVAFGIEWWHTTFVGGSASDFLWWRPASRIGKWLLILAVAYFIYDQFHGMSSGDGGGGIPGVGNILNLSSMLTPSSIS